MPFCLGQFCAVRCQFRCHLNWAAWLQYPLGVKTGPKSRPASTFDPAAGKELGIDVVIDSAGEMARTYEDARRLVHKLNLRPA